MLLEKTHTETGLVRIQTIDLFAVKLLCHHPLSNQTFSLFIMSNDSVFSINLYNSYKHYKDVLHLSLLKAHPLKLRVIKHCPTLAINYCLPQTKALVFFNKANINWSAVKICVYLESPLSRTTLLK